MKRILTFILIIAVFCVPAFSNSIIKEVSFKLGSVNSNQVLDYPDGNSRSFDNKSSSALFVSANIFENKLNDVLTLKINAGLGTVDKGMQDKYHYYLSDGKRATDYYVNSVKYISLQPRGILYAARKRLFLYGFVGLRFDFFQSQKLESPEEQLFLTFDGSSSARNLTSP